MGSSFAGAGLSLSAEALAKAEDPCPASADEVRMSLEA